MSDQVGAQGGGDGGEDDVVHRSAEPVLDRLHLVQREARPRQVAEHTDVAVERRRGLRAENDATELHHGVGGCTDLGERAPRLAEEVRDRAGRVEPPHHGVPRAADQPGRAGRQRRRLENGLGPRHGCRLRARVEHHVQELNAAHPIDHAMMHLADERAPIPAIPVDQVDFPERPGASERLREDPGRQLRQLGIVAGRLQRMGQHVMMDVESGIGLPGGMREAERHGDHALRVAGDQVQPRVEVAHELLEIEPPLDGVDARHVQELTAPLEVEEGRIERGHPIAGGLIRAHGCLRCPRART